MIQVQAIDGQQTISRIELAEIIIARYEEIFTLIREELEHSGAIHGLYHGVVLTGDACQIEGMVNLARRMLGVSAHLGNPPLQVYAEDQHLAALRRSMYATASGLLMFSQSDLQDAVEEPEEANDRSFMDRVTNGWNALNSKLKAIF